MLTIAAIIILSTITFGLIPATALTMRADIEQQLTEENN